MPGVLASSAERAGTPSGEPSRLVAGAVMGRRAWRNPTDSAGVLGRDLLRVTGDGERDPAEIGC